jgi:hypothetical protein
MPAPTHVARDFHTVTTEIAGATAFVALLVDGPVPFTDCSSLTNVPQALRGQLHCPERRFPAPTPAPVPARPLRHIMVHNNDITTLDAESARIIAL